MVMIDGLPC